jgi:hypothetical protein
MRRHVFYQQIAAVSEESDYLILYSEDGGKQFFRNVSTILPDCMGQRTKKFYTNVITCMIEIWYI